MKYRVWCIINPPSKPIRYAVNSPSEGKRLIDGWAKNQLADSSVISNVFGLEVFEDGEWWEWYDEDGNDVDKAVHDDMTEVTVWVFMDDMCDGSAMPRFFNTSDDAEEYGNKALEVYGQRFGDAIQEVTLRFNDAGVLLNPSLLSDFDD